LAAGQDFRQLLVSSWEYAVEFRRIAQRVPAVAWVDSVPSSVDAQLRRRGEKGWKRRLAHHLHHYAFQSAAQDFRYFLTAGSDAAEALQCDYGVDYSRTFVTFLPQDLEVWAPGPSASSTRLRLTFVGNDFLRKGGDFLLRLFADHLSEFCTLTIASNDPVLEHRELARGVEWLRGRSREQLIEVFQRSDVFVFPTRQDFGPNAVCEALACGVPCIASDVGGIRDLVHDDVTGFLMPYDAPAATWVEFIRALHADRAKLARLAQGARRLAEQQLSLDRFRGIVNGVIQSLLSRPAGVG
jgi:glycosyltransferase involved in cell wall biosynthesis